MLGLLLFLSACVTINVYFPAAEAEQAADRIIRGIYGEQEGKTPPAAPEPASSLPSSQAGTLAIHLLDWLISPAQAAADINIQSPATQALRKSMEARFQQLETFYQNGSVGMTHGGLIAVRDLNSVALPDRKQVKSLVADENSDRNALYAELARANGHPDWESDIRDTFAARWVANAPAGWWYQNAAGQWQQK
jgi:uncharacterized protein YdbL (DUF1318 family)